jgi:glycerophosphoryl diester phosphodiesterase
MCELDVQLTRDGVLVVIHDETVDRTTDGVGRVEDLDYPSIQRLDAGSWRDPRFAGERISTLQEVVRLVRGRCQLNIELKADGVAQSVCELVRKERAEDSCLISSFDWPQIEEVRHLAPELPTALLASRNARRMITKAVAIGAVAINPRHDLVNPELCSEAHRQSLRVYPWTVDDAIEMRRVRVAGVDGIMTNYPARLAELTAA